MATFAEVEQLKQQCLAILDEQIMDAIGHKNALASEADRQEMDRQIHRLMKRRDDVFRWAVSVEEDSLELQKALKGLQSATAEMNEAAARMKATTEFLNNAAALLGAADKALAALQQA